MAFVFENLTVYQKSLDCIESVFQFLKSNRIDNELKDQLKRAITSITLNIAEGGGRFSKNDKKNFYTIARGSVYESVAVFQILKRLQTIEEPEYTRFYELLNELAKMLNGMINSLKVTSAS